MDDHEFSQDDGFAPADVRIHELHIEPWSDGRRVRVHVDLTPFQKRPNLQARITGDAGEDVASIAIIESMEAHLVFTMHLRVPSSTGHYRLTLTLDYDEIGTVDERTLDFEVHPETESNA